MSNIPVSIVILTHNEQDSIERCLKSITWCDDILLLDDSTDETVSLAKKIINPQSLRIIPVSEQADFAKLRNFGLTKARYEWVFFLDGDEEVSNELFDELDSRLRGNDKGESGNDNNVNGFYLKRKDYFLGAWLRYGETGEIKLLKLAKKTAGKWVRSVHEVWQIKGSIGQLSVPLLHYPHPTIAEFLSHINRWTTLDAEEFFAQGVRSSWWKIIAYPKGKFVRNYILKQGFRDGTPGLIMALMMSFHSFLTRAKLYMLEQGRKNTH